MKRALEGFQMVLEGSGRTEGVGRMSGINQLKPENLKLKCSYRLELI